MPRLPHPGTLAENPRVIEFLVEEQSAEEALRHLLPKLVRRRAPWKVVNLGSKHKLLAVLPQRLAAYRQRIISGEDPRRSP